MPPVSPLALDGLWRCLCPSYNSFVRSLARARPVGALHTGHTLSRPRRSIHLAAPRTDETLSYPPPPRPPTHEAEAETRLSKLKSLPTAALYDRLRQPSTSKSLPRALEVVTILVRDRHEKPNARLYSALLRACALPSEGSAYLLRKFLLDMEREGVELDAGLCHDALEALAVHPDYLLLDDILEHMRTRWFTLSEWGHNLVVAALLRSRQFELALDRMNRMGSQGIQVYRWLQDILYYVLAESQELEEAFYVLQVRADSDVPVTDRMWNHALEVASKNLHYNMTKYVWSRQVELSYMTPSFGICANVLNTAARYGDVRLATDVFRILTERGAAFEKHDYELLLEAYINAGDLKTALSILPIMEKACKSIDKSSTRVIFKHVRESAERPEQAFYILLDLKKLGEYVPTESLNTVMEAAIDLGDLYLALEQYKALHEVCRDGPNTRTFDVLLKGCLNTKRKDLAMFLATEMVKLKVQPSDVTYSRLIRACLLDKRGHEDAFNYFSEMTSLGMMPKINAWAELVDRMVAVRDMRVKEVYSAAASKGFFLPPDAYTRFKEFMGEEKLHGN